MLKHLVTATFLAGLITLASGCNTMKGLGEDIQSLGGSIEGAASENRRDD